MPDTRLTLKEACAKFDVTPRTLRYYEQIELITPEKAGRTRYYGPKELARLTLILRGRRFGFTLEDIRQWLDLYQQKGSRAQYQAFLDLADRRIAAMVEEHRALAADIEDLRALRAVAVGEL